MNLYDWMTTFKRGKNITRAHLCVRSFMYNKDLTIYNNMIMSLHIFIFWMISTWDWPQVTFHSSSTTLQYWMVKGSTEFPWNFTYFHEYDFFMMQWPASLAFPSYLSASTSNNLIASQQKLITHQWPLQVLSHEDLCRLEISRWQMWAGPGTLQ